MNKVLLSLFFILFVSNSYSESISSIAYCPSFIKCNSRGPCYAFDNQGIWRIVSGGNEVGVYKLLQVTADGLVRQDPATSWSRFECQYVSDTHSITYVSEGLFAVDLNMSSRWNILSKKLVCSSDNSKDCPLIGDKSTVFGMHTSRYNYISFGQDIHSDSHIVLSYENLLKEDCPSFPIYHYKVFYNSPSSFTNGTPTFGVKYHHVLIGEVDLDLSTQGVIQIIDVRPDKNATVCRPSQKTPFNIIGCL